MRHILSEHRGNGPVHPALIVVAAAAVYGALFPLAHELMGPAATTLVVVPVATIAWLAGTRAGIVAAALSAPVNLLLLAFVGSYGIASFLQAVLPVAAGMAYLAATLGWLRSRQTRAEMALQRGVQEKAALAEIGRIVNSTSDMSQVYRLFAEAVMRLIHWDRFALSTVDDETDELTLVHVEGLTVPGWEAGARRQVEETILGDLFEAGHGVRLADAQLDSAGERRPGLREYAAAGLHSFLAAPLVCDGRIIGAMSLGLARQGGYSERDLSLAENVASQIAGAIARSQLHAKAVQLAEERELRARLEAEKRELQRISEAKSEFLSTVSHELKTPLATILGFTDVLSRNRSGNLTPRQVDQLGLIQRNGRRLGVLINDLVDVSGIDAGRFDIAPTEFDGLELLSEVAASFGPIIEARKQKLDVRFPESPVTVSADRNRIAQVMTNLLTNATKYSPEGAAIHFEAAVEHGHLAVTVRDQGLGISLSDQRRLFTSFFRARNEATRSVPGTGLGLVICKRIIDLHGGSISFETAEGAGTTMRFRIPGVVPATVSTVSAEVAAEAAVSTVSAEVSAGAVPALAAD